MLRTSFLAAAAAALFATMASAQFCSDNLYPARLVDQEVRLARDGTLLASARCEAACLEAAGFRPRRIPPGILPGLPAGELTDMDGNA